MLLERSSQCNPNSLLCPCYCYSADLECGKQTINHVRSYSRVERASRKACVDLLELLAYHFLGC